MKDNFNLLVNIARQELYLQERDTVLKKYLVSTAANGAGEQFGSFKTPRGLHIIRAKIGNNQPINTVFVERRPTGEIYTPCLKERHPRRDWILTRIMWLSGLELGKKPPD